jgi:hypothetical protein
MNNGRLHRSDAARIRSRHPPSHFLPLKHGASREDDLLAAHLSLIGEILGVQDIVD